MLSEDRRSDNTVNTNMLINSVDEDNEDDDSSSSSQRSDSSSVGFHQSVNIFRPQRLSHQEPSAWIQPNYLLSLDLNSDVDYNADSSSVAASIGSRNEDHSPTSEMKQCMQHSNNNSSNESSSNGNEQIQQRYLYSMLNRPSILGTGIRRKKKKIIRTNDYFNVSRNVNIYNLIRYSFSSKYAQQYLRSNRSKFEIENFIENCKNVTTKIIPEEETIVQSKILLVSNQNIKQAKRSNRKFKNSRWHRLLNQGVKFQS